MIDLTDKFQVESYGEYSSNNYGVNALKVTIDKLQLWFSYKTIIAFQYDGHFVISKNYWGNTSGKHLNWIDRDKKIRKDNEEFQMELKILLELLNINLSTNIVDCSSYGE